MFSPRLVSLLIVFLIALTGCPNTKQIPGQNKPVLSAGKGPSSGAGAKPIAKDLFITARFEARACPKGTIFDGRKGGECWTCRGLSRTGFPVTGAKACAKAGGTQWAAALPGPRTRKAAQCKAPRFWDAEDGRCWRCPKGFKRSGRAGTTKMACRRSTSMRFSWARFVQKSNCSAGQFYVPRKGGQCWSCPGGYQKTTRQVTGTRACIKALKRTGL